MKKILLIVFLVFAGVSFGQAKEGVDQRLVDNHGDEIYQILKYRKDYYNFLLFELDNAYEIVNISDLTNEPLLSVSGIQNTEGVAFNSSQVNQVTTFNFMQFNFVRQKESNVYYDLGDGRALKFTALKVFWKQFDDSGLNTKD